MVSTVSAAPFNHSDGFDGGVDKVLVQPDGKIIVTTQSTLYKGQPIQGGILRLEENGTIDTTFSVSGNGFDGSIYDVALQANGQIIVGGAFTDYDDSDGQ